MYNWTNLLLDESKIKIKAIFGDENPVLSAVDLHEIKIHRDGGPDVYLRFDLSDYPSFPPKKWAAQGFNCVQLELAFIAVDVSGLSIKGWCEKNVGINITEEGNRIKLLISNDLMHVEFSAEFLRISYMSAYLREAI